MKKLIIFLLTSSSLLAQSPYSLEQCVEMAQKNSPQAGQIPLIWQAYELQTKLLKATNMPQASIGGQASWQSEVTSFKADIPIPNFAITPPPKDQYRLTLDATQNIWDGKQALTQKNVANASALVDEMRVKVELNQLREQVSALFFGAILAEKQKANVELLKTDLANKIQKLQASVKNGVATKSNILLLEARVIEIEQQLLAIQHQQQGAFEGLSLLMGVKVEQIGQLLSQEVMLVSDMSNKRPELQLFVAQKEAFRINEDLLKVKYSPKLNAFATGGYGRPGLNVLATGFNPYFVGGLQLRVPLSQLYTQSKSTEMQQLKISQDRIEKQKEQFVQMTEIRASSQKQEIKRLEELLNSDKKLIEMRTKLRQVADVQLENGLITSGDYVTELNNESIAKQNLSLHEIQLQQAKNNLKILLGQ